MASINRLAAFTGVRFFRSCAIQCLAVTRDGTSHSTPSTVRSVAIDPFRPDSISLLIQIIEGHAPKRITLQQAFDIFAVLEYCLADCLFELLPEYLEPLLERLNSHEVRHRRDNFTDTWCLASCKLLFVQHGAFVLCQH